MLVAALAVFSAPVLAQAKECNEETKTALYTKYYDNLKKDQAISYATAKEYLALCPSDDDQYTKALKKFTAAYEAVSIKNQFNDALRKKNYADALNAGKQILATDPGNVRVNMLLGYMGYSANESNPTIAAATVEYAKKAIELVESGKAPDSWDPFTSRDEALAWENFTIGTVLSKNSPSDALPYLLKAARYDTAIKNTAGTYYAIEQAYESGPYAKQSEAYKTFAGQPESPAQQLALANINQLIDRMIDAYARAVALAGNDPKVAENKKQWAGALSDWYKFRHDKSDAGMDKLIASALQMPLPDVPAPITTLPTPAPTPTPGTAAVSTDGSSAILPNKTGANPTAPPAGNRTTTGAARTAPATPAKRPRSNHRHG